MARGRPKAALRLALPEREALEGWARASHTPLPLAQRARIVLACAEGQTNAAVGASLGASPDTVGKWRRRFLDARLDGLGDARRSGAPRRSGSPEWVLALTLLAVPTEAPRWTSRALARACGLSQSSVSRLWREFGLRPWSVQAGHRRAHAATAARFRGLARLYLDAERRARARIHRVASWKQLSSWLGQSERAVGKGEAADLILCGCPSAEAAEARRWVAGRARFRLLLAPPGEAWTELLLRWFPGAPGSGRAGAPLGSLVAEIGGDLELESEPYTWTPAGQELIGSARSSIG